MGETLDQHWEDFIRRLLASGRYRQRTEVIEAGLALLHEHLGEVAEPQPGDDDADADIGGAPIADEALDQLIAEYGALAEKKRA